MFLKSLNLTNFRIYSVLDLKFDNRPTLFVGDNAAGKSSILEAIYLLSTTKSQRVENENELIQTGKEFTKIEGFVENPDSGGISGGETELLMIINKVTEEVKFRKKVLVNGIGRRTIDFIGNLPSVIFYPSDINMITGLPSLRRWHLDLGLAQINSQYKKTLTQYEQFLTSRNRVLKRIREGLAKIDELDYWTTELIKYGEEIAKKRVEFFEFINNIQTPLGEFKFEYIQNKISLEKLKETNGREVAAANTLIGPHRDDFRVILSGRESVDYRAKDIYSSPSAQNDKGKDLAHYGSRGEQRTATLAFKLAQLEYMAKMLGKRPVLLLDDVFSELDALHRAHVVEIVGKQQTIIATVELENIPQDFLNSARILRVEDGKIVV